jgi:hypothetical protein
MFTYVRFLYAIFVMVIIYFQINLKLKFFFFSISTTQIQMPSRAGAQRWQIARHRCPRSPAAVRVVGGGGATPVDRFLTPSRFIKDRPTSQ